jgi:thiamine-monophosphate kinase
MSESDLIARIRELFPRAGDDAAVVGDQVITNDVLVEDIDFTAATPLRFVARKAIAVNLSDLAAMGARPLHAVVAVASPDEEKARALLEEFGAERRIEIVGGDLSRASKLFVSVTAVGEAKQPLLRRGARRGDRIYVSRPIGGAAAGLFYSQHPLGPEAPYILRELAESALRRHLDPEPEIELGMKLAGVATACIDVSDGLSSDLHHLCDASGVGAEIERQRIPVFPGLEQSGLDVRQCVLHGGEEFALLFTSSLRESELSARVGRPVYAIGRIVEERGVRLDGAPLAPRGWDHFSAS